MHIAVLRRIHDLGLLEMRSHAMLNVCLLVRYARKSRVYSSSSLSSLLDVAVNPWSLLLPPSNTMAPILRDGLWQTDRRTTFQPILRTVQLAQQPLALPPPIMQPLPLLQPESPANAAFAVV